VDINRAWETIRENIKISAKESLGYSELKKHKPLFDEGCSKLSDQTKQAGLQCLGHLSIAPMHDTLDTNQNEKVMGHQIW
jgi:hypothetical protein